mmetsp:Transcript_88448/g.202323  ORF Transcript_88448/g.202323 Transcript_88448/m.202323 type:complete len:228 (+) Transcript_88448:433-1116(+)
MARALKRPARLAAREGARAAGGTERGKTLPPLPVCCRHRLPLPAASARAVKRPAGWPTRGAGRRQRTTEGHSKETWLFRGEVNPAEGPPHEGEGAGPEKPAGGDPREGDEAAQWEMVEVRGVETQRTYWQARRTRATVAHRRGRPGPLSARRAARRGAAGEHAGGQRRVATPALARLAGETAGKISHARPVECGRRRGRGRCAARCRSGLCAPGYPAFTIIFTIRRN